MNPFTSLPALLKCALSLVLNTTCNCRRKLQLIDSGQFSVKFVWRSDSYATPSQSACVSQKPTAMSEKSINGAFVRLLRRMRTFCVWMDLCFRVARAIVYIPEIIPSDAEICCDRRLSQICCTTLFRFVSCSFEQLSSNVFIWITTATKHLAAKFAEMACFCVTSKQFCANFISCSMWGLSSHEMFLVLCSWIKFLIHIIMVP